MSNKEINNKKIYKKLSKIEGIVNNNNSYVKKIPDMKGEIINDIEMSNTLHQAFLIDNIAKETYQVCKKKDMFKNIIWVLIIIIVLLSKLNIINFEILKNISLSMINDFLNIFFSF